MSFSKVSIIMASYNKAKYINESIQSVINQTYSNLELLIIDDASMDTSINVINQLSDIDSRIQLYKFTENKGANYCRNFGLSKAQGKYVIFLDADDLLVSTCVAARVNIIDAQQLDFCVFSMGTFFNRIGDSLSVWQPNSKYPLIDFMKHDLPWSIMQPIWRKDFLRTIGGFDETFERLQDVELHTRALLIDNVRYNQIQTTPDCFYRIDEGRKNYNIVQFLDRWISSSVKYHIKFNNNPSLKSYSKYLKGTIYKTYTQILYHYKLKLISKDDFLNLEKKLFDERIDISSFDKFLFTIVKCVNLFPIRFIGFNYLMRKLMSL